MVEDEFRCYFRKYWASYYRFQSLSCHFLCWEKSLNVHVARAMLLSAGLLVLLIWYRIRKSPTASKMAPVSWQEGASAAVLAGGITLRLRAFLAERSLWADEVSLAIGVRDSSLLALLSEPLPRNQSAPPGFLALARWGIATLGEGPLSIRIVPLVSGVLLLIVAQVVGRMAFQSGQARLAFLLLVAFAPTLVYYSTEFKQYSTDALMVLTALYVAHAGRRPDRPWLIPATGFVAASTSIPGALAFLSLGIAVLLHSLMTGSGKGVIRAVADWHRVFVVWALGGAVHLAHVVFAGTSRAYMTEWWSARGGFPPQRFELFDNLLWYLDRGAELLWMLVEPTGPIGPGAPRILPGALVAAGALLLYLAATKPGLKPSVPALFVGMLGFSAWFMAEAGFYPLSSRLMIYLLPVAAFVLARGFEAGILMRGPIYRLSAASIAVVILASGVTSTERFVRPNVNRDMQAVVNLVSHEFREGDVVVVASASEKILEWHDPSERIPRARLLTASYGDVVSQQGLRSLEELNPDRVWLVSTHRVSEADEMARILGTRYADLEIFNSDETLVALMSRRSVVFLPTGDRNLVEVLSRD